MYLDAGPSGQTMDQEAALSMVRPDTEGDHYCVLYVSDVYLYLQ